MGRQRECDGQERAGALGLEPSQTKPNKTKPKRTQPNPARRQDRKVCLSEYVRCSPGKAGKAGAAGGAAVIYASQWTSSWLREIEVGRCDTAALHLRRSYATWAKKWRLGYSHLWALSSRQNRKGQTFLISQSQREAGAGEEIGTTPRVWMGGCVGGGKTFA